MDEQRLTAEEDAHHTSSMVDRAVLMSPTKSPSSDGFPVSKHLGLKRA